MAGIVFKGHAGLPSAQALRLYEDAGWTNYTNDPGKLMRALDGSLGVISVWDGDTLVGLASAMARRSCTCRISCCCVIISVVVSGCDC